MVSPKKSCLPLTLEGRMTHPDTLLAWGQEWEAPAECDFLWLGQLSLPVCGMAPNTCSYCCSHCINPQSVFMDRKLQPSSGMKLVALSKVHRKGPTHSSAPLTWFAFYTHTSQIRGLGSQESWGGKAQEVLFGRRPFLQNPNSKWSISTNPASVSITQNDLSNGSIHLFFQQMFTEISARYCFRAWGVSSENIVALLSCNARQGKDQQQHRSGKYLLLSCK